VHVVIIGAGAVGLSLGSFLLAAGDSVQFAVRDPEARSVLRSQGFERHGLFGNTQHAASEFSVVADASELSGSAPDCVLVCTKSTASSDAARWLQAAFAVWRAEAPVVLCQNGWGNTEIFARFLPRGSLWNARVITGFQRRGAARVEVTVHAEPVRIGSLFAPEGRAHADEIERLCRHISRGGLPCEPSPDIARDLLAKLLYNCALNPLGAILGVPYGTLGARPETRALIAAVVREVFAVLAAAGLSTHWAGPDDYLEDFYARLLPPTEGHESSMLQDLRAGRPTEIDALSGAVVALGETHAVATPVNGALRDLVHGLEG
jgi:2-dehydropantoate 2-reductase